ncbi:MoaD/ThiS family protein [Sporomusa sp.]|uniref:MoaD/ThiS family protein n=1 Tax=Sporomusa sp. TaxID=2078658 RepID=UPI002C468A87|nr:MoaD/ThiS family protein [Sporomusa sp.]HWR43846.1 MoaD/ThiS family protein [Sporomusa sp.]
MALEIRLFATLRNYFPDHPGGVLSVEATEAATIDQVIAKLNINPDEIKIIMVNGVQAQPGQALKDGDRVGLFPPVGGG